MKLKLMDDVTTFYWYVLEGHSFKKKIYS